MLRHLKSSDGMFEELLLKTLCSFPLQTADLNHRKKSKFIQILNYVHKLGCLLRHLKSSDGIFEELLLKALCSFPLQTTDLNNWKKIQN